MLATKPLDQFSTHLHRASRRAPRVSSRVLPREDAIAHEVGSTLQDGKKDSRVLELGAPRVRCVSAGSSSGSGSGALSAARHRWRRSRWLSERVGRSPRAVDPVRVLAADNSAWSESPLMREPRSDPAAALLPAGSKMPVAGGQPCQLGK